MAPDDAARERTVQTHLALVHSVASRYRGLGLSYDDLVQEGSIGLLDAIEHHDPARGPFEPYARFRIRRAIRNALTDTSRLIRLPKHVVERRREVDRMATRLAAESGRQPTPHEIAAALELQDAEVVALRGVAGPPLSLDQPAFVERVADGRPVAPDDEVVSHEEALQIDALVAELPRRQRDIVERHFGLGRDPEPISTVARALHISDQRARAIENDALATLRDELDPRQASVVARTPIGDRTESNRAPKADRTANDPHRLRNEARIDARGRGGRRRCAP